MEEGMNMPWYKGWDARVTINTPRGEKKKIIYGKTLVDAINSFRAPDYGTFKVSL